MMTLEIGREKLEPRVLDEAIVFAPCHGFSDGNHGEAILHLAWPRVWRSVPLPRGIR